MNHSFLLLFTLWVSMVAGQVPQNVMIHEQSGLGYPPCEPSIAISQKDPSIMVAGAVLKYVCISQDSGQTWKVERLKSKHGVYGDPCLVSDPKGKFYYFHLSDPTGLGWGSAKILDRIVCQYSTSNGRRWSRGSGIGFNHPKDQDKEWAIFDPIHNQLIVCWTQFDEYNNPDPEYRSNILMSVSQTGKTWSDPALLSTTSGNCLDGSGTTEGATSAVGPTGIIYTTWGIDGQIVMVKATVDKVTNSIAGFSEEQVIVASDANWSFDIPGLGRANGMPITKCDLSEGPHRGSVYVNWADQRNGSDDTDIWLIKSMDEAKTWSDPIRVNDDPAGSHQFFSWMDIDQSTGYIYIVYYDRRNYEDNRTDVYLATSRDGGESFENRLISESPFIPSESSFFGDYNNISVVQGVIRPIWTRYDDGKMSIWTAIINE